MNLFRNPFKNFGRRSYTWLHKSLCFCRERLGKYHQRKPVIDTYACYGRDDYLFLKGRVLRDSLIHVDPADSKIKNLINNYKRFGTVEIPFAKLRVY